MISTFEEGQGANLPEEGGGRARAEEGRENDATATKKQGGVSRSATVASTVTAHFCSC